MSPSPKHGLKQRLESHKQLLLLRSLSQKKRFTNRHRKLLLKIFPFFIILVVVCFGSIFNVSKEWDLAQIGKIIEQIRSKELTSRINSNNNNSNNNKNRLVQSLSNDLSRAKEELERMKRHERNIEKELLNAKAQERSKQLEAEQLKSKLIGAGRDQVEDVVEDRDELLRDWEFELGDPVDSEASSPPPSRAMIEHEEHLEFGKTMKVKVGEKVMGSFIGSSDSSSRNSRSHENNDNNNNNNNSEEGEEKRVVVNKEDEEDASALGTCVPIEHTEYWGAVVLDGNNHKTDTAGQCCDACRNLNRAGGNRCNVWVYNPQSKACWLKFEKNIKTMKPANQGPHIPWIAGTFTDLKQPKPPTHVPATGKKFEDLPRCLHGVMTSSGNVYMNWQSRIMYQTWQNHASQPGSILKSFTRILHKGKDDELMKEIPTMRFEPIQTHCDTWCDYPVADRSDAIARWSQTADSETCSHIIMLETDHVIVKSPPESILLPPGKAYGFEFTYINVNHPTMRSHFKEEYGDRSKPPIPRTGNSPTVITATDLRKVAPKWAEYVERTEKPDDVKKSLGWLRDMYAYDLAAYVSGVEHIYYGAGKPESIMAQPPADENLGGAFILHYTWGPEIYDETGTNMIWKFDKRAYGGGQYQRGPYELIKLENPPQWRQGLKLQTFFHPREISESKHALIQMLITEINGAIDKLPRVPKGHSSLEEAQLWASN